jgi:hypothetical protein
MILIIDTKGNGDIEIVLKTKRIYPIGTELVFSTSCGTAFIAITGYDIDMISTGGSCEYKPCSEKVFGEIGYRGVQDVGEIRKALTSKG